MTAQTASRASSHTPAAEREHPGRTVAIVAASAVVLTAALFAGTFAVSRVVELLAWFAGS